MHSYNKAIITGSIAYDDIMDFPSRFADYLQPDKLHMINVSFVVDKLEKQIGGTGTNIAYNTHLMTEKPTTLLGGVGKDGNIFLEFLKKNGLSTDGILIDEALYTATGKVITDKDHNQICGFYYGAGARGKDIDVSKYIDKNSLLVLSASHPESLLHFQREAVKLGVDYVFDPGMSMSAFAVADLREGVLKSRIFIGNDYEISQICKMTGLTVPSLLEKGITVITTLGEHGVRYESQDEKIEVSAYPDTNIIDPTGAGDAWRGGFVAGLLEKKPIVDCLKQGNALASFAVEKVGTVNHTPTREEVEERAKLLNC